MIPIIAASSSLYANQTITLAHETNWVPHYGKSLPDGGYTVGIVREAMSAIGYTLDAQWMPWKRALQYAESGEYDGLGASYCSIERQKVFVCSDVIANDDIVFFKRKSDNISYTKMEDLKNYRIGVGKGYSYPKAFEDASFLTKKPATDLKQNILKLDTGRIDIIIGSKQSIMHNLHSGIIKDKSTLEQLGEPISTRTLHVLFSKASENFNEKNSRFNEGLKTIRDNGKYDAQLKKFGL